MLAQVRGLPRSGGAGPLTWLKFLVVARVCCLISEPGTV